MKGRQVTPHFDQFEHRLYKNSALIFVVQALTPIIIISVCTFVNPTNPRAGSTWSSEDRYSLYVLLMLGLSMPVFNVFMIHRDGLRQAGLELKPFEDLAETTASSTTQDMPIIDKTRKKVKILKKGEFKRPTIAWPTVLLALLGLCVFVSGVYGGTSKAFHWLTAMLLSCVGIFICFTPLHEAVHNSICPRNRRFNDAIGFVASLPFAGIFSPFRFIHLMHHRYANDRHGALDGGSLDPDHYAGEGPQHLLPLRWASVFMNYTYYLLRMMVMEQVALQANGITGSRLLSRLQKQVYFLSVVPVSCFLVGWWVLGADAVWFWILPFFTTSAYLMYVFDYIPHRPHVVSYANDPYRSTSATTSSWLPFNGLTVALLFQNYHNIHHLYPYIPFYGCSKVWHAHKAQLKTLGTRELPFFLWPNREHYLHELRANDKME